MSSCSRVLALLQSVEEMARLIAELDDLRIRVQRAEATALARRRVAVEKSGGDVVDLTTRRAAAARSTRAVARDNSDQAEMLSEAVIGSGHVWARSL